MSYILNLETAVEHCSVAIGQFGDQLALKQESGRNEHAARLPVLIQEALKESNIDVTQLNAIAVSIGPGSYTGLRVGLSLAKGMAYALKIPLISIPTLQMMAWGMRQKHPGRKRYYCPMIDARRMEVYTAIYNDDMESVMDTKALIITPDVLTEFVGTNELIIAGNGAAKTKEILSLPNVHFDAINNFNSATYMVVLAQEKLKYNDVEDLPYCEPLYLKQFGEM